MSTNRLWYILGSEWDTEVEAYVDKWSWYRFIPEESGLNDIMLQIDTNTKVDFYYGTLDTLINRKQAFPFEKIHHTV